MDALSPTPERSAELAALRRRAYGPNADIQRDAHAVARLRELESQMRAPDASTPIAPASDTQEHAAEAPVAGAAAGEASVRDSPALPPHRRWGTAVVVAVAFGALVVGGIVGGLVAAALAPTSGPEADATLHIDPANGAERGPAWDQTLSSWGLDPSSTVPYESYLGLHLWTGVSDAGDRCILVAGGGRPLAASCAAGDLEPMFDYRIDQGAPVALEQPLPNGTVIRFIARQSSIDVWLRTPAGWEPSGAQPLDTSWRASVASAP